jgi:hypothetical protein
MGCKQQGMPKHPCERGVLLLSKIVYLELQAGELYGGVGLNEERDIEKQKPYHCHKYIDMAF